MFSPVKCDLSSLVLIIVHLAVKNILNISKQINYIESAIE